MIARPILFIRSLLFAVIFYTITPLYVLFGAIMSFLNEQGMQHVVAGWGQTHRFLCRIILRQKIEMHGTLPKEPILYVFKHESMFETIDLLCMFDSPAVIAKQELLDIPGWGWIAKRHGMIGIERTAGAKALRQLQKDAKSAVAAGKPICFFPEGTRVPHGETPPLRAGFAALYQILKLPVVPVAVNSGLVAPRHSFIKKPGIVRYIVGETIPAGLPRDEAEARVHAAINVLNHPAENEEKALV